MSAAGVGGGGQELEAGSNALMPKPGRAGTTTCHGSGHTDVRLTEGTTTRARTGQSGGAGQLAPQRNSQPPTPSLQL